MLVVGLISGGKDSCHALELCRRFGHQVIALANLHPSQVAGEEEGDELDSYSFQTVGHQGIEAIAECLGLPLFRRTIGSGEKGRPIHTELDYEPTEEDEVEELYELLRQVKQSLPQIEAVSTGAILSDYQRLRVENVCDRLGLISLSYLWQRDQKELLEEMIQSGLEAILIKVAALGLNEKHLNKTLRELQPSLLALEQKYGINVCGEGGEYESFTLDSPLFNKAIQIEEKEIVVHSQDAFAPVLYLRPKRLRLVDKPLSAAPSSFPTISPSSVTQPSLSLSKLSSPLSSLPEVGMHRSGDWLHLFVFPTATTPLSSQTSANETAIELHASLSAIQSSLGALGGSMKDVYFVYLHLREMSHFTAVNEVYKPFFAFPNPPSRACVGGSLPFGSVVVECLARLKRKPKALHVQSISSWAPACIGPYSQASMVDSIVILAGMIGLDPPTMKLLTSSLEEQIRLVINNVSKVWKCAQTSWERTLIARWYITKEVSPERVLEVWNQEREKLNSSSALSTSRPLLSFLVVPSLPRNAQVELHCLGLNNVLEDENGDGLITGSSTQENHQEGRFQVELRTEVAVVSDLQMRFVNIVAEVSLLEEEEEEAAAEEGLAVETQKATRMAFSRLYQSLRTHILAEKGGTLHSFQIYYDPSQLNQTELHQGCLAFGDECKPFCCVPSPPAMTQRTTTAKRRKVIQVVGLDAHVVGRGEGGSSSES